MSPFDQIRAERDACGIGFVADARGRASRQILDAALEGLANVRHRGAVAADRRTGDGAGVLLPIPRRARLPGRGAGSRRCSSATRPRARRSRSACVAEGIETRRLAIGACRAGRARRGGPRHDAARSSSSYCSGRTVSRPTRRSCARSAHAGAPARSPGAYVVSLSFRTITYKALCAADQLGAFYPDLRDAGARGAVRDLPPALLDQHEPVLGARAAVPRCSATTARSTRSRATSAAMRGREASARDSSSGRRSRRTAPDSALLDNALELLVRSRPRRPRMPPRCCCRARGSTIAELDDGGHARSTATTPASSSRGTGRPRVVFTDGRVVGAALDRNGLRPLRYRDRRRHRRLRVRGRCDPASGRSGRAPRAASAPARCFAVDPGARRSSTTRPLLAPALAQAPVCALADGLGRPLDPGQPVAPPDDDLTRRQRRRGLHARGPDAPAPRRAPSTDTSRSRRWATTRRCRRSPAGLGRSSRTCASASPR